MLTVPGTVKEVGDYAFSENQMTDLTLEEGIVTLKRGAFGMNELEYLTIPSSVDNLYEEVFRYNKLVRVRIKGKSRIDDFDTYSGSNMFGWASGYDDSYIIWNY